MAYVPFEFDLSCSADNYFDVSAAIIRTGINLSNYVTKSELSSAISAVEAGQLTYTSQLTNDSGFLTEHQAVVQNISSGIEIGSVGGTKLYAPTTTNVDLSNYYTKAEIDNALGNPSYDMSNYYTKTESDNKYIGETDVYANFGTGTAIGRIGDVTFYVPYSGSSGGSGGGSTSVDLSNYYTKSQADSTFVKKGEASSNNTCVFG